MRQIIGMKPSDDPKADMLINSNINQSPEMLNENKPLVQQEKEGENQNE
jgi:hypothetical protein